MPLLLLTPALLHPQARHLASQAARSAYDHTLGPIGHVLYRTASIPADTATAAREGIRDVTSATAATIRSTGQGIENVTQGVGNFGTQAGAGVEKLGAGLGLGLLALGLTVAVLATRKGGKALGA